MDLSNQKCKVPKVDNRIYLKITRKVPKYTVLSSTTEGQEKNSSMNDYLLQNDLLDFWLIINKNVSLITNTNL